MNGVPVRRRDLVGVAVRPVLLNHFVSKNDSLFIFFFFFEGLFRVYALSVYLLSLGYFFRPRGYLFVCGTCVGSVCTGIDLVYLCSCAFK